MADDPKKKKKAAAPADTGSLAAPYSAPNADAELTDEEFRQKFQQGLTQPAEGETPPAKQQEPTESPVKSWWDKFNGVMSKQRDPAEIARGAARGVVNAGIEAGRTALETATQIALPGASGRKLGQKYADTENKIEESILGKRPEDGLAAFTESATQFIAGFAATNAVLPGSGLLKGLAKGAIVDAAAFNPYEAQLAELAARTNVPGLKQLGELLSVEDDDTPAVARLKRAAGGAIPGAVMDGLVAGFRSIRAGKKLAAGATGAEKKAAEEALDANTKVLKDVADGTHVAEDTHTKVVANEDGTFSVQPLEADAALPPSPNFKDKAEALQQAASMDHTIQAQKDAGSSAFDADALEKVVTEGVPSETVIKASPYNTLDQDLELVKKLSESIIARRSALEAKNVVDGVEGATGWSITIEQGAKLAKDHLSQIPEGQLHETLKGLLKANPESQDIVSVMTDMVLGQKGRNIVKLHDVLESRAHDPATMDQLKAAIANYFELRDATHVGESAGARRLRFVQERDVMRKETFETAETAQASAEARAAAKDLSDTVEEIEKHINRTDTNAVSASDFSFARARKRLEDAYAKIQKGSIDFEHDPDVAVERAGKIKEAADEQRATPEELQKLSPEEQAQLKATKTSTTNPIEELSRWLDSAEGGLDTDLAHAEKGRTLVEQIRKKIKVLKDDPVGDFVKGAKDRAPEPVAGMKTRDVSQLVLDDANAKTLARMFKLSGGNPVDVDAVFRGAQVLQKGGTMRAALEVFTNSLLSGPPTWATVVLSGQTLSHMEPVVKIAAGAIGGNKAMVREGVDTLFGLWAYLGDNIKTAAMAMREGRSIINPAPMTFAIGGRTGRVIRAPGNIMMGLDEYTRVANYRAYVRAQSLRAGREAGLEGTALMKKVSDDLRASFDSETGIATIPQALRYADKPTLSAPLRSGFGRELQNFTNNALIAKFVFPFVRASTNIWDYVWQATPGLNLFNKQAREIIQAGGEEAAALHARSLLATTVGLFAFTQAQQGNLTGKGPSDPKLRAAWLKDHQPYSIRVGDKWVSYNRMDPIATPLGIMADLYVFGEEMGHEHHDFEQSLYATLGAVAANMGSKTYLRGIFDLSEAWSKGDSNAVGKYLQRQVSAGAIPFGGLINRLNPDPYYREVDSMMDAIKSRLPYFSETLDARYNFFGEKIMKAHGYANRALNPMTVKDAGESKVETELLAIGKSLAPFPEKIGDGMIDMHSKEYAEKPGQPSPYTRMMELLENPGHGAPSLREAMEKKIAAPHWNDMSDGTDDFRGGRKLAVLSGVKERYESRALRQVMREYPKLGDQYRAVLRARGAAMRGGEEAVQKSELLTGPYRQ